MPSYNLQTIRGELKTLIETVTEIAFVYSRRNPNIEGFPAVIFDITRNENEMLTNIENLRTIVFSVWIIQEIGKIGASEANRILDVATKKVVEVLEKRGNLSLSGNVDWMMPVEGPREEVQGPQGTAIWQQLDLNMRVSSSVL